MGDLQLDTPPPPHANEATPGRATGLQFRHLHSNHGTNKGKRAMWVRCASPYPLSGTRFWKYHSSANPVSVVGFRSHFSSCSASTRDDAR